MPRCTSKEHGQLTRKGFECQGGLARSADSLPAGPSSAKMGLARGAGLKRVRAAYPQGL